MTLTLQIKLKIMRILSLLMFCTLLFSNVQAQDLYHPRKLKMAYENGTRSFDGTPGKNYWQNTGDYVINITATPPNRTVKGSEQITYFNNSPDSLKFLVFKLFLNNHKPGAPRNHGISKDFITSGVHIDSLSINGEDQNWKETSRYFTWQPLKLPASLAPGDSVRLSIDWHYQISLRAGREGMIDSTTYYLAYFYPRVAVYDDYNGWDRMNFAGSQEFYSDFNNYTVNISVPKNYIVWGTGTLENPGKVLQPDALQRYKKSMASDQTIHVATLEQVKSGKITAQDSMNTWTFRASNIPDMAFGLSNHFVWDAASVVVDDETNRRAGVQAAYNDTSADYHQMVNYGRHALDWFSHKWPEVPYPYEKTTVFQGGAGMEYPMMANDAAYTDSVFSRFVAEHEIAHTYFPFYMGINESRYAFMDEGWATTLEYLIGQQDLGHEKAEKFFQQFRISQWIHDPSTIEDLPIITPADMLKGAAYGNNAYGKAALGYLALKDLLGDQLFKKCLHTYMDRWHGKHPTPWDFFYSFNDAAGQNLNWFWNSWYFDNSYIDLAIVHVRDSRRKITVSLKNIGGMPAPVNMRITYDDGSTEMLHQTPEIWKANIKKATVTVKTRKDVASVELDGGIWMDANVSNNLWSNK
jgi:hypothetical protein